jgi:RNA polymerase sigma factor (sigma-70 family)
VEASALPASVGLARARLGLGAPLLRLRSDEQLVSLFRAGNEDAFRVIHDRYRARLLAYTRQMLSAAPADAEDAVQEIFVRAYAGLRTNRRDLALRAWLYRVAHNRCVDELRRPRAILVDEIEDLGRASGDDPHARAEEREALSRLIADVRRLPEQQRSALLMRELGGMAYADMSGALGVTVPAVKSLLVRARVGLAQASEARDTACAEVREDLIVSHDRGVRSSGLARRHMRDCPECRRFRTEVRGVSHKLSLLLPALGPIGVMAKVFGFSGLGIGGGSGAAAGTSAAAGTGAAAGTTATAAGTTTAVTAGAGAVVGGTAAVGTTTGAIAGGSMATVGAAATGAAATGATHVVTIIAATVVAAGGAIGIHQAVSAPARHHHHHAITRIAAVPEAAQAASVATTATTTAPPVVGASGAVNPAAAPSASAGNAPRATSAAPLRRAAAADRTIAVAGVDSADPSETGLPVSGAAGTTVGEGTTPTTTDPTSTTATPPTITDPVATSPGATTPITTTTTPVTTTPVAAPITTTPVTTTPGTTTTPAPTSTVPTTTSPTLTEPVTTPTTTSTTGAPVAPVKLTPASGSGGAAVRSKVRLVVKHAGTSAIWTATGH